MLLSKALGGGDGGGKSDDEILRILRILRAQEIVVEGVTMVAQSGWVE